jgi:hypothetical protein
MQIHTQTIPLDPAEKRRKSGGIFRGFRLKPGGKTAWISAGPTAGRLRPSGVPRRVDLTSVDRPQKRHAEPRKRPYFGAYGAACIPGRTLMQVRLHSRFERLGALALQEDSKVRARAASEPQKRPTAGPQPIGRRPAQAAKSAPPAAWKGLGRA